MLTLESLGSNCATYVSRRAAPQNFSNYSTLTSAPIRDAPTLRHFPSSKSCAQIGNKCRIQQGRTILHSNRRLATTPSNSSMYSAESRHYLFAQGPIRHIAAQTLLVPQLAITPLHHHTMPSHSRHVAHSRPKTLGDYSFKSPL